MTRLLALIFGGVLLLLVPACESGPPDPSGTFISSAVSVPKKSYDWPVRYAGYPCLHPSVATGSAAYVDMPVRLALDEINAFRRLNGLPPLVPDKGLAVIAEDHLHDLVRRDLLTHYGADGTTLRHRLDRRGYLFIAAGENLSGGFDSYHEAVHGWIDSPGHRANLLRPHVTRIGLAYVPGRGGRYKGFRAMVLAEPAPAMLYQAALPGAPGH